MAEEKKIIVDDDWKKQAQQEKLEAEKKLEQEKQARERTAKLPKGDFAGLVGMLSTQGFYAMGLIAQPGGNGQPEKNLELARYTIDMLGAIEEKTKGNLSKEEENLIKASLSQLRMAFVKVSQEEDG